MDFWCTVYSGDDACCGYEVIVCFLCATLAITHTSGRQGEHFTQGKKNIRWNAKKETATQLTRLQKEKALQENLKSAVSDHCKRSNHVMDWDGARIIGTEENKVKRWIKEAMEIRRRAERAMNRDEGGFMLSHTWDTILQRK